MAIISFPPVHKANPEGLLAVGGDLEVSSLLLAYSEGIFPWPISSHYPLAWFCPDPRGVLQYEDLHVSKSLKKLLKQNKSIKYKKLIIDKNVSKVSIIGVGMVTTPGVTYRMFQSLANKRINILVISTSEIKISVLINKNDQKKAVSVLHQEFKLNN